MLLLDANNVVDNCRLEAGLLPDIHTSIPTDGLLDVALVTRASACVSINHVVVKTPNECCLEASSIGVA